MNPCWNQRGGLQKKNARQRSWDSVTSEAFREWLRSYARPKHNVAEYEALIKELHYVNAGRKLTREEMNER
jgi:hypothetical protein